MAQRLPLAPVTLGAVLHLQGTLANLSIVSVHVCRSRTARSSGCITRSITDCQSLTIVPFLLHLVVAGQGRRGAAAVQHDRCAVGRRDAVKLHMLGMLRWNPFATGTGNAFANKPASQHPWAAVCAPLDPWRHQVRWRRDPCGLPVGRLAPTTPAPLTRFLAAFAAPRSCLLYAPRSSCFSRICAICPTLLMSDAILPCLACYPTLRCPSLRLPTIGHGPPTDGAGPLPF